MTFTSYPFDNQDTTETQYSILFRELQDSGIVGTYGDNNFRVTADGSGMDVQLGGGVAILQGHLVSSDAITNLVLSPAASAPRIDRIALRLDPTANTITPVVITGTPATSPVMPALTQTTGDVWDLPIAFITVTAGMLNVTQGVIGDQRSWVGSRIGAWTTATRPVAPRTGKTGLNVTTGSLETFDGSGWSGGSRTLRVPHTFTIAGDVQVNDSEDTYYIPPFFVPVPSGKKARLIEARYALRSGTNAQFRVLVNSNPVAMGVTASVGVNSFAIGEDLTDNAIVAIQVDSVTGTPKGLTCSLYVDYSG